MMSLVPLLSQCLRLRTDGFNLGYGSHRLLFINSLSQKT
jgi:hypothetical protein